MNLFPRRGALLCLLGVACLLVGTESRGETVAEAKKRAFAELLAKRTKAERAHTAHAARVHAAAMPQLARIHTTTAATPAGIPAISPVAPSGFGFGRDAFVEAPYPEILGRSASQSEVDYWARLLVLGVPPHQVADFIWFSPEHRAEVASGTAPGIPLNQAYRAARAYGNANKLGPVQ